MERDAKPRGFFPCLFIPCLTASSRHFQEMSARPPSVDQHTHTDNLSTCTGFPPIRSLARRRDQVKMSSSKSKVILRNSNRCGSYATPELLNWLRERTIVTKRVYRGKRREKDRVWLFFFNSTSAELFEPSVNIDQQLYFLAGNSDFLGAFLATLPQPVVILL